MQSSFLDIPVGHPFPLYNLPYGVFEYNGKTSVGVAIGDYVLDLTALEAKGLIKVKTLKGREIFSGQSLNAFLKTGKACWSEVREFLRHFLAADTSDLRDNAQLQKELLIPQSFIAMKKPIEVSGYTDFYSSIEHATNIGKMFRDANNPLLPNWRHLPVGYDGRASAIVVSGTKIKRPHGQLKIGDNDPIYAPTRQFDTEVELGFIIGTGNDLGSPISIHSATDHVFGAVMLLDWSARDIQRWEYVPLGPFLGKNFGTTISPWIVTMEALAPFSVPGPVQDPRPLPYLLKDVENFNINLHLEIKTPKMDAYQEIARTNYKHMYWDIAQQVAHHTANGCNLQPGDVLGTGTISGPTPDSCGSLIELTWGGANPIKLISGEERVFLSDHDSMRVKGIASMGNLSIGFGYAEATVASAVLT